MIIGLQSVCRNPDVGVSFSLKGTGTLINIITAVHRTLQYSNYSVQYCVHKY